MISNRTGWTVRAIIPLKMKQCAQCIVYYQSMNHTYVTIQSTVPAIGVTPAPPVAPIFASNLAPFNSGGVPSASRLTRHAETMNNFLLLTLSTFLQLTFTQK